MLFIIYPYPLKAQQVCTGKFGKPMLNITFGAGKNPGPAIQAASATYTYTTAECPNDGEYTIRNNSLGCYYEDWHTVAQDHTGDSSGYFLLNNASFLPSDFYLGTVNELCSSTTYQFEAWILNMTKPSSCGNGGLRPNITFKIENSNGAIVDSFNTNDIEPTPTPKWQRFRFTFSTQESSIALRMHTNTIGGCGGDFAIDDITLSPCEPIIQLDSNQNKQTKVFHCKSKDTSFTFNNRIQNIFNNQAFLWETSIDSGKNWTIIPGENNSVYRKTFEANIAPAQYHYRLSTGEVKNMGIPRCLLQSTVDTVNTVAEPIPNIPKDTIVCENDSLLLIAKGAAFYNWSGVNNFNKIGDSVYIYNLQLKDSGRYIVKVGSIEGCTASDSFKIRIKQQPVVNAGEDQLIIPGNSIQLKGTITNLEASILWSPNRFISNTGILEPFVNPTENILYTLTAISTLGCGTASDEVMIYTTSMVKIPNAFSPNKDGINDNWVISNLESFNGAQVSVFNRYGQRVFFSNGSYKPWNGTYKGLPLPFATYYYIINLDNKKSILSGSITIIR